jgi:hypothetical protein
LPLSGLAGNNPASYREKNTPTPELFKNGQDGDVCDSQKYVPMGLTVTATF